MDSDISALERAVEAVGGQSAAARICNVTQAAVWHWLRRSKKVPAEHVRALAEASGVAAAELRPDIFGQPAEAAQ